MKRPIEDIEREAGIPDREDMWKATFIEAVCLAAVFFFLVGVAVGGIWF